MANDFQATTQKKLAALEGWLAPIFAQAPHLPASFREFLATIAPWLSLIFGILGLIALLSAGVLLSVASLSFMTGGISEVAWVISVLAGLIAAVLQILAFSPLKKRQKKGWNYIFYGTIITTAAAIIEIAIGYGSSAIGTVIGTVIGLWLLFEVRPLYR